MGSVIATSVYYQNKINSLMLPDVGEYIPNNGESIQYYAETGLGLYDMPISKEVALRIFDALLIEQWNGTPDMEYLLKSEYYITDTSDGLAYKITRRVRGEELGGGWNILICKEDGRIIGSWMSE